MEKVYNWVLKVQFKDLSWCFLFAINFITIIERL